MITRNEILETNSMISDMNLDVRTITMGISLLDCADADINKFNEKVYKKITTYAKDLVKVGDELAKEYGVSVQTVGQHARKENWVSGCRNERRRRAESRDCLLEMTRALMRGAKRAAEEAEKGEACTKELKELAGILQTLAGLEKELGGGTAAQTVRVLMGEGVRELSE